MKTKTTKVKKNTKRINSTIKNKKKHRGGDKQSTKNKQVTKIKQVPKFRQPVKNRQPTSVILPTFISSEGEDDLEASISFLLELMGGSLYETYVEEVLNDESNQKIKVVQVPRPSNPPPEEMIRGEPKIFYGSSKGTHFTCTLDGIKIWNSYSEGIQKLNTDHFCQTFSIMRMQYEFLPNSFIGEEYAKLQKSQFLDNAMIAMKVACYIIELLQTQFDIDSQVNVFLQLRDKMGKPEHIKNPNVKNITTPQQIITHLMSYCKSITKEQLCNSTFKQKIFMLI